MSDRPTRRPNGSRIVFENACCSLGPANVYTVSPAGGALTNLTHGHGVTGKGNDTSVQDNGFYDPVWSPDGTKVLLGHEFLAKDGSFQVGLAVDRRGWRRPPLGRNRGPR